MKYATDQAFRTALEARLKQGQTDSAGVSRLRKRIVFERLLARLVAQASGEWVLKGGFALELRLGTVARSTKDADFDWRLAENDARVDVSRAGQRGQVRDGRPPGGGAL